MGMKKFNLSNILFSKTQRGVLGLLYGQPDSDFYTNEIIRSAQSGRGAVQRELAKLSDAGLIIIKALGNQKRYQANRDSPFFAELRSIVLKTFGLADIVKEALNPQKKNIDFAFIYGSITKQEDNAQSEIDLMIISDKLTYTQLFQLLNHAEEKLRRKINPIFYSNTEWQRRRNEGNNFITQLINQPKIFLIGTADELNKLGKSS